MRVAKPAPDTRAWSHLTALAPSRAPSLALALLLILSGTAESALAAAEHEARTGTGQERSVLGALKARSLPLSQEPEARGALAVRPIAPGAELAAAGSAEGREDGEAAAGDPRGAFTNPAGEDADAAPRAARRLKEERARREAQAREEERRYRDQLLDESIERLLPLEPEELRSFIHRRDAVEGAVEPGPARMRVGTRALAVTPGGEPPVIRLTAGYSSTILFLDATGQPWPVLSVILGNARAFQVSQPRVTPESGSGGAAGGVQAGGAGGSRGGPLSGEDGLTPAGRRPRSDDAAASATANVHSNLVNVVPLTNHAASNLVVTLEGAPYPVILHLLTESSAKEGRLDDALVVFRMEGRGPNAKAPVVGPSLPGAVDGTLLAFVHGLAPGDAKRLRARPELPGVQVWELDGRLYVRSRHQAVWPAWSAVAAGEGLRVYVMPKAPSVVLSVDGRRTRLVLDTGEETTPR